jgi:hypothetical protein
MLAELDAEIRPKAAHKGSNRPCLPDIALLVQENKKRERASALFFILDVFPGCFAVSCSPNAKNPVALGYGVSWAVRA